MELSNALIIKDFDEYIGQYLNERYEFGGLFKPKWSEFSE
jgi:hypothetical protein